MENFLKDLLDQLISDANLIKTDAPTEFESGKLHAYYAIISRILNQAEAFDIAKNLPNELRNFHVEDLVN